MRMDIFGYMDEEDFFSMLSDAHMKEDVSECHRLEGGGLKAIDDESVDGCVLFVVLQSSKMQCS